MILALSLAGCVTGTPLVDELTTTYRPDGTVESVQHLQISNQIRVLFPGRLDKTAHNVRYAVYEDGKPLWLLQTGDMSVGAVTGADIAIGYGPYTLEIRSNRETSQPAAPVPPDP